MMFENFELFSSDEDDDDEYEFDDETMPLKEVCRLISWLEKQNVSSDKIIECIKYIESSEE